jgi:hypothetical protein
VGALLRKRVGYRVPVGKREYDESRSAPRSKPAAAREVSREPKPRSRHDVAGGCFGCHMSLLDIDERILELVELVEFDKSPINDIKEFTGRCAVGLIEGGCCNEENVDVLRTSAKHCDVLISVGDCATMGGIPRCATRSPSGVPRGGLPQRPLGAQPVGADARTTRRSRCC